MRTALFLATLSLFVTSCGGTSNSVALNPDPNHTHADFAVWVDGERIDFSKPAFMSGSSDESDPNHTKHDKYLHLHDGNGHVIHRHKPGLTLKQFFATLDVAVTGSCYTSTLSGSKEEVCSTQSFRLFVNGVEKPFDDLSYIFADTDKVLITNAAADADVQAQLKSMTDDACLYSKTCPERGDPPAEGCIADPTIPCVGS